MMKNVHGPLITVEIGDAFVVIAQHAPTGTFAIQGYVVVNSYHIHISLNFSKLIFLLYSNHTTFFNQYYFIE